MLTIGKLAGAAGVRIDTVRYYERRGLMPEPRRSASGYRNYDADAVRRLRFIRRAQALGFTLDEIGELLALRADPANHAEVRATAQARLADIDGRIRELAVLRDSLSQLVRDCAAADRRGAACPILDVLERGFDTADGGRET